MHPTHPSLEYLLVAAVAAATCYLTTPIARMIAVRFNAIARPRDRDVHAVAIPRMGGLALLVGVCTALFVATRLPTLKGSFDNGPQVMWIIVSAVLICAIGAIDDRYELDSLTKLAGQVLATGVMVTLGGVQLVEVYVPWVNNGSTVELGQDLAIPITILLTVLTINAVNFIDGLDGLLAGVSVIAALSFFAYSYHLGQTTQLPIGAAPTVLSAVLAGTCMGFLPHNFFPARIFMGDSGSMLVGLMLSAAATTATTNADPTTFSGALGSLPLALPLIIPLAVLALPFVDLLLAVVRRVGKGQSPFRPDKRHLHHRLLALGHSHRRAVLLLYFWSALFGFGGAAVSIVRARALLITIIVVAVVLGLLLLVVPRLRRMFGRSRPPARPARPAGGVNGVNGVGSSVGANGSGPAAARLHTGLHRTVHGVGTATRDPATNISAGAADGGGGRGRRAL